MNNKSSKECSKACNCSCKGENEKTAFDNCWDSVPRTYDAAESCHKHEKTAGNNQWCSTNK